MARVLYLTYDGLLEPLGHSQVLQYLKKLSQSHAIFLISFEKARDWADIERREELLSELKQTGIRWKPLRYHSRPSAVATAYDICAGLFYSFCLVLRHGISIVHARSYVTSVMALGLRMTLGCRFLFDMRGFWADERVERAGLPKDSPLYRSAKWFERQFFTKADAVVSLTHAGVKVIRNLPYLQENQPPLEVIPTCTDLERFRLLPQNGPRPFTLGYVGSADTAYLFEPVLSCFRVLRQKKSEARLLVLTRTPHDYIRALLKKFDLDEGCVEMKSVSPDQVPEQMAKMDAGIFFVKPGFSTCASVPTKLGEFLACGIPCIGNAGIGDLEEILEGESVGVIVREFSPEAESAAISSLLALCEEPQLRTRCAAVARRIFDLEKGVASYDRIYRSLCSDTAAITCKESSG